MDRSVSGVDETLARARRRLRMRRLVRVGAAAAHVALWIGASIGAVASLAGAPTLAAVGVALAVTTAITALVTCVALVWPGLSRRELALLADRALGTEELLVTALHVADGDDPRRDDILASVARTRHTSADVARALPLPRPRHLRAVPVPILALAALLWFGPRPLAPLLGLGDAPDDPLQAEAARLQERLDELDDTSDVTLPEELEREISDLADELAGDLLTEQEALERLDHLQDQLADFQERLEPSQDLLEDLETAAERLSASEATRELGEALDQGDLGGAADAARDLSESLSEATPEQQQQAAEALDQAGKQLQGSSDPALQQTGNAMRDAAQQARGDGAAGDPAGTPQPGQGAAGEPGEQQGGLSPQQAEQLAEQLQQARDVGEQLQRDQQALDRAQQMNAAAEASRQRLGGDPRVAQGDSSQGESGGDGTGEEGQGGSPGGQGGEGDRPGQSDGVGESGTGAGMGAGTEGHTWEDQGEFAGGPPPGAEDRNSNRTESAHIDDFEKFYEGARLDNTSSLLASVEDEIDENGRVDELTTRLTSGDEEAVTPGVELPAAYREQAAEAIEAEQIPPGYRDAVKQYFDGLD